MINQERARKQEDDRRESQEASVGLPDGSQGVVRLAKGLDSVDAALDGILADYASAPGPTAIIGAAATKERPLLRNRSSEEFVRAFRQRTGQ